MKYKETAVILEQREISDQIYSLWLHADDIVREARPGQFVSVYCRDESRLLPRPISICELDKESGRLRLVYRAVGAGTQEFSGYGPGETLELIGPLGNGFPLDKGYEKPLLIGGGIGVPPMVELAKWLPGDKTIVSGRENRLEADAIFACGPAPMLRALKAYAAEQGIDCYLSLEERMACGIGACLACVCTSKDVDAHTNVKNKRICKDGPVFAAEEIEL